MLSERLKYIRSSTGLCSRLRVVSGLAIASTLTTLVFLDFELEPESRHNHPYFVSSFQSPTNFYLKYLKGAQVQSKPFFSNNRHNFILSRATTKCDDLPPTGMSSKNTAQVEESKWYYEKMKEPSRFQGNHAIFNSLMSDDCIKSYHVYRRVPDDVQNVIETAPKINGEKDTTSFVLNNGVRKPLPTPNNNDDHSLSGEKKKGRFKTIQEINKVYPDETEVICATFDLGTKLNGHPGIVHGGILSLLFDDTMGFAYEAVDLSQYTLNNNDDSVNQNHVPNIAVTANLNVDFRAPVYENQKVIMRIFHKRTEGKKLFFYAYLTNAEENIIFAEAASLYIYIDSDDKKQAEEKSDGKRK